MTESRVSYLGKLPESGNGAMRVLREISGQHNTFTIPRLYAKAMGSLEGGLLLSQIVFWSDKGKDGWFYKSYAEWTEETMLTEYAARKHVSFMVEQGFLVTEVRKALGAPTVYYYLDEEKFQEWILRFQRILVSSKTKNGNFENEESYKQKITTEDYTVHHGNDDEVAEKKKKPTTNNVATTAYRVYARNVGKLMPAIADSLDHLINQYGDNLVAEAIKEAVANNRHQGKPGINFIAVIAKRMYEADKLADSRRVAVTPETLREREAKPKQATVKSPMVAALQAKLKEEMEKAEDE